MWGKLDGEARLLLIAAPIAIAFFAFVLCTGWRP